MSTNKTTIMTQVSKNFDSPIDKLIACIDAYHSIDDLSDREEVKFDMRNAMLIRINTVRTRVPMPVRQLIAQWMYSETQWNADKGRLK